MNSGTLLRWRACGRCAAVAALAVTLAACSTPSPPREQMAVSRAAVERATGAAANEAPAELAVARDKLRRAQNAMDRKDYEAAKRLAEEAQADAALAEATARNVRAHQALAEVQTAIQQLQAQIPRR